jgi:hypothetical protein
MNSSHQVPCNNIGSKAIKAETGLGPSSGNNGIAPSTAEPESSAGERVGASQPIFASEIAQSFVIRRIAAPLARLEIRSILLAGRAAGTTLTFIGGALTMLATACSSAAATMKARQGKTDTQSNQTS